MKSNVKKIKECRKRLEIQVEPERVEARFREVLAQIAKEVTITGFRQGKAPIDMVEKKFSKEAEEETLKSIVPEAYHQAVTQQKLSPVSLPKISEIKHERGKPLQFTAEFDDEPEFQLKSYKGVKVTRVPADVAHEEVEKGVASLLESRAQLVPLVESRAIQRGDFIVTDIDLWQEGQYVPGKKGVLLFAEPNEEDDFYEKVVGAQVDEVREISAGMSEEERAKGLVGRKPFYKVWIRGIREKKVPELNEEFAKSFGLESVDALREAVRKDLARQKLGASQSKMRDELFDRLLEQAKFPVPDSLVDQQKERLLSEANRQFREMGMPPDKFESEMRALEHEARGRAERQVRLYFILQKIADAEKIEPDEIELERRLEAIAAESKRPMEEVRRVFEEDLRESLREKQTVEYLLANAKFEEKAA